MLMSPCITSLLLSMVKLCMSMSHLGKGKHGDMGKRITSPTLCYLSTQLGTPLSAEVVLDDHLHGSQRAARLVMNSFKRSQLKLCALKQLIFVNYFYIFTQPELS